MHCAVDAPSPQLGCFAEISTKGRFVSPAQVAVITDRQSPDYGDLIMTGSDDSADVRRSQRSPTPRAPRQSASPPC
jgi:hypothetical protein